MALRAFKPTNKLCQVPGCCRLAVKTKLPVKGKTLQCLRHQLYQMSGRIGPNWMRDRYREHLKSYCELRDWRWSDEYKLTKKQVARDGIVATKMQLIRWTTQSFDVDHIDGNHNNNNPSNLQTLYCPSHRLKSRYSGDHNPTRNKKC